jgi:hypothetical protein
LKNYLRYLIEILPPPRSRFTDENYPLTQRSKLILIFNIGNNIFIFLRGCSFMTSYSRGGEREVSEIWPNMTRWEEESRRSMTSWYLFEKNGRKKDFSMTSCRGEGVKSLYGAWPSMTRGRGQKSPKSAWHHLWTDPNCLEFLSNICVSLPIFF